MIFLLALLAILPHETAVRESCDRITVNSFYDDNRTLVFDQLLFEDWQGDRFQLRGWRMVKWLVGPNREPKADMLPRRNQLTGLYECRWIDGDVERVITAPVVSYSRTVYDVELADREFLPKEMRRELRNPKTMGGR